MKPIGGLGVGTVLAALLAVLAAEPAAVAAPPVTTTGWAVLIEQNFFRGRYRDLPVGFANSNRMLATLVHRGWSADQILLVRDDLDRALLARAASWLSARVRPGDRALLYVASEYQFLDRDLLWTAVLPGLWRHIPTTNRVLIVETCFAERLTAAIKGSSGLGLPAVGRDEWDWWGLRETGRLVRGGPFTYFLARAIESQPTDAPTDFGAAFSTAVAEAQDYFHTVIATTPGALAPFHANGDFPERRATFPNPHLVTGAEDTTVSAQSPSGP